MYYVISTYVYGVQGSTRSYSLHIFPTAYIKLQRYHLFQQLIPKLLNDIQLSFTYPFPTPPSSSSSTTRPGRELDGMLCRARAAHHRGELGGLELGELVLVEILIIGGG